MVEKFEYDGSWFLPNEREIQVPGKLKFDPDEGARLELIGIFKSAPDEAEIILGESIDGRAITLHKCFQTNLTTRTPGLDTSTYYVNIIFIGIHFFNKEEIKFKKISVCFSYLNEWLNTPSFKVERCANKTVVECTKLAAIPFIKFDDYQILVDIKTPINHNVAQGEMNIKQKAHIYIVIDSEEEKPFEELLKIMYKVKLFLSFGVSQPVYEMSMDGEKKIKEAEGRICEDRIEVFYPVIKIPVKSNIQQDILFPFADVQLRINTILEKWISKTGLLESVYNLYFASMYSPEMYGEYKFLSLIQALESYHRRTMDGFELSKEDHKKRITEIIDAAPSNHKDWLKNKLAYSNELTLRKRLKEILELNKDVLSNFIDDGFINKIVDTRNYLTHYDEELKDKKVEGLELWHITEKLRILIEICLFKKLDFTFEEIKRIINRNRRYGHEGFFIK